MDLVIFQAGTETRPTGEHKSGVQLGANLFAIVMGHLYPSP